MLRVTSLRKTYLSQGGAVHAIRDVSLDVAAGEFFTLLGPSGCGKTTTLHCIAGLETPDSGEIVMDSREVFSSRRGLDLPVNLRDIGVVFQSYAIWPHMTVFENVAFPLVHGNRRSARADVRNRVMHMLQIVKLGALADRPTPFLSGGQQQRVALARALVHEPRILLCDEPLSNLDAQLRAEMRGEIRQITRQLGMTTIYVTHDRIEALSMSDRVAVMHDGLVVQQGSPREIYFHPRDAFCAGFLGASNIIPGKIASELSAGGLASVETAIGRFVCRPLSEDFERAVSIVLRPEVLRLCTDRMTSSELPNTFSAEVEQATFVGDSVEVVVIKAGIRLHVRLESYVDVSAGETIILYAPPERCAIIPNAAGELATAAMS